MRTKNSILNLITAFSGQTVAILAQFVARMFFVKYLSAEYLGVSGLFGDLITILSLVELGVGPAMSFSLYKPLSEGNTEKVKSLMSLYKKLYRIIGILVLILGVVFLPLYPYLINGTPNIPNINLIYLLFILNVGVSYFYSYKRSIIVCDQKKYITTILRYGFYTILNIVQIICLALTRNYILFLCCQVAFTWFENITISIIANKQYQFLKEKTVEKLNKEDISGIKKNVLAMLCHKIGGAVVLATDNILLTRFVGLIATGLFSNYRLITSAVNIIASQFTQSIVASVGNLNALQDKDKVTKVFGKVFFANSYIFGFSSICLAILIQPFIILWLGKDYCLEFNTMLLIVLNFYLGGMRQSTFAFRDATGSYYYDRYKPFFEAIINLCASIFLLKILGINGVFIGTFISHMTTCFWVEPYVLYKHVFKTSIYIYFKKYAIYTAWTMLAGLITFAAANVLPSYGLLSFCGKILICMFIPNIIFFIAYRKTPEFMFFHSLIKKMASKIKNKLTGKLGD